MKRVLMCVNYSLNNPALGISKKIKTQIESFEKMGYEVTYSAYTKDGVAIYCKNSIIYEHKHCKAMPNKLQGIVRSSLLMKTCKEFLDKYHLKYDIGYIRWTAMTNSFVNVLKCMDKKCKKVWMDCHGYHPGYAPKTLKGRYIKFFTDLNSHKIKNYIDLCLVEFKGNTVFDIPAMTIDTGIDVDKYQVHCYNGNPDSIELISVANELPYHGYDRIIKGVCEYTGNRPIHLHLVGKMNKKTIALAKRLNHQKRIKLYGYRTGEELDAIYSRCNIGIGPLAPHRSGGKQGTGIKTKEYFAIGLPYFYAGQELLVPNDYPYVLKLDSNDNPIDIERVIRFFDSIKNDCTMSGKMREFAKENFSWVKIYNEALRIG